MDSKTYNLLRKQDWGEIAKTLVGYTVYRARMYSWRGGNPVDLALHTTAEDIVQNIILKTLDGRRVWDPEKGELIPWLRQQINSELDHLVKSAAHRYEQRMATSTGENEENDSPEPEREIEYAENEAQQPEKILLRKEKVGIDLDHLLEAVGDDTKLEEMVFAMLDGCPPKAQALAERLQVPVRDIYNRKRRLRRRLRKLERDSP